MNSADYCNTWFGYFTCPLGVGIVEGIQQAAPKPVDITNNVQEIFQTQIPLLKEWAVESSKQSFPWLCLTAVAGTAAFYGIKFLHQKMHENFSKPKEIDEVQNNAIRSRIFDGMRSATSTSISALKTGSWTALGVKGAVLGFSQVSPYLETWIPSSVMEFGAGLSKELLKATSIENPLKVFLPNVASITSESLYPFLEKADHIALGAGVIAALFGVYKLYQGYRENLVESPKLFLQEAKLSEVCGIIKNISYAKNRFQNVLLSGSLESEQEEIAKNIARESRMNYVRISGDLLLDGGKDAFKNVATYIKNSAGTTLLFLENAECLQQKPHLERAFLHLIQTQKKKVMLVVSSDKVEKLQSFLPHMDYKLDLSVQDLDRKKMLSAYVLEVFRNEQEKLALLKKVESIAEQTHGFSSLMLFKLVSAIDVEKRASKDKKLTDSMIDSTVERFVDQERKLAPANTLFEVESLSLNEDTARAG